MDFLKINYFKGLLNNFKKVEILDMQATIR